MTKEYSLKDIEYDSWDSAFDDFNNAKARLSSELKWSQWYDQQCFHRHTTAAKKSTTEELNTEVNTLLDMICSMFDHGHNAIQIKQIHPEDILDFIEEREYDDDEYDEWGPDPDIPWNEDDENIL